MSAPNYVSVSASSLKGLRVLYLDGATKMRNALAHVLKQYGARVTATTNIREALDIVDRERPELIVADVSMADHHGYDFIREVRRLPVEEGGQTPALAFSRAQDTGPQSSMAAGFTEHVSENAPPDRLVSILSRLNPQAPDAEAPNESERLLDEKVLARLSDLDATRVRMDTLVRQIQERRERGEAHRGLLTTEHSKMGNRVLDTLPNLELERVYDVLRPVRLEQGELLCSAGDACKYAYFPTTAVISLVWLMESGKSVEVVAVGRDGFVGIPFVLDPKSSPHWWKATVGGEAWRAHPNELVALLDRCPSLRRLLLGWTQFQFVELSQSVACRRIHTIENQVARWLLSMADRSGSSSLNVTHDTVAELLGTRRAGVSVVMEGFRRAGLIASQRGRITILDGSRLRAAACECYEVLNREFDVLFGRSAIGAA